ncbi:MAG: hypothetical protein IT379_37815 [Deltaproteobacteria bacterium]|nr:hypothetical protein [Deltaproteobacteria bacterium]
MRQRAAVTAAVLACVALATAPAAGCEEDASSSIVAVIGETHEGAPLGLDELRLEVERADGAGAGFRGFTSTATYTGGALMPWSVRVEPESRGHVGSVLYRFRAEGYRGGEEVVAAQSRLVFVPRVSLTLPLRFEASCEHRSCARDETCAGGACTSDYVPACGLIAADEQPRFCRDMPPPAPEAGTFVDGGRLEMGPTPPPPSDADVESGVACGAVFCAPGQQCCTSCSGLRSCGEECPGHVCPPPPPSDTGPPPDADVGPAGDADAGAPPCLACPDPFVSLSVGRYGACAIRASRQLVCWGRYDGVGPRDPESPDPTLRARLVGAGDDAVCVVPEDGALRCLGRAAPPGILDALDVSPSARASCVVRGAGSVECWSGSATPTVVMGVAGATAIRSYRDTFCVLLTGGEAECWQPDLVSLPFVSGAGAIDVASSGPCYLDAAGTLASCPFPTPTVQEIRGSGIVGFATGFRHLCALTDDGVVSCLGLNYLGQLGDGTRDDRDTAAAVAGLGPALAIDAGEASTCALLRSGDVACWGELQLPGLESSDVPVLITPP